MKKKLLYVIGGVLILLSLLLLIRIVDAASGKQGVVAATVESTSRLKKQTKETTDRKKTKESKTTKTTKTTKTSVSKLPVDFPKVDLTDGSMVLVGPLHKLDKEIDQAQLGALSNGYLVDKRIIPAYEQMTRKANADGFPLVLISAFRSVSTQQMVFDANVKQLKNQGKSDAEAIQITKLTFTEPGFSEHHTGLAVDVVDKAWYDSKPASLLDETFSETEGAKWLKEHAREYGFIIRYPKDKHAITQIDYEPWHLRYVGVEAASYIEKHQLTFEEFLEQAKEKEVENESTS